jgi:hypothetical protein
MHALSNPGSPRNHFIRASFGGRMSCSEEVMWLNQRLSTSDGTPGWRVSVSLSILAMAAECNI